MKKWIVGLLIFFFLTLIIIPAVLLIFGLQSKPLVTSGEKLGYADVERVKQLLRNNDPRKLNVATQRQIILTERDLNLFLDYALQNSATELNVKANTTLSTNQAICRLTHVMPSNPFGQYLNLELTCSAAKNTLALDRMKIGSLVIPKWLLKIVFWISHVWLGNYEVYRQFMQAAESIQQVQFEEGQVTVVYRWQPEMMRKLRQQGQNMLLSQEDRQRLYIYEEQIAALARNRRGQAVSLIHFLQPLFQTAYQRTAASGDPSSENRTLIMALAAYGTGRNVDWLLGAPLGRPSQPSARIKVLLLGREDLAKHFLLSAAIAASAGSGLADLSGVFKELSDSQGGSGFSFADLAADRAGVRLAQMATDNKERARLLQARILMLSDEQQIMPRIDRLPEGIQELEFRRQYRDLDSKTYQFLEQEIDRRIAACQIYQ